MNTLGLGLNKKAIINDGYPKPDLNQLVPFKPVREWKPNHGTIPGNYYFAMNRTSCKCTNIMTISYAKRKRRREPIHKRSTPSSTLTC